MLFKYKTGGPNHDGTRARQTRCLPQVHSAVMDASLLVDEGFPEVECALAYGSGALPQKGYGADVLPMLDLILVVADPEAWHRQNLETNRAHYSGVAAAGPGAVARLHRSSAGVYYNTLIPMVSQKRLMKYGVVTSKDLSSDLRKWDHLYLSGRLHKPVTMLSAPPPVLANDLNANLSSAVRTALHLLPGQFTTEDFFLTITGLSYHGDFRMLFGENPDKVRNIVSPQIPSFEELYAPILLAFAPVLHKGSPGVFHQDTSPDTRSAHTAQLPAALRATSAASTLSSGPLAGAIDPAVLSSRLQSIVFRSSLAQSAKGVLTAGPLKSGVYSAAKVGKWVAWWSRRLLGR